MIGISTSAGPRNYWQYWLKDFGLNIVELDLRHSYFPLYQSIINLVKKDMDSYNLSFHSASESLFSENPIIRKSNQQILLSEIELARIIGAKEIVFHAPTFFGLDVIQNQEGSIEFLSTASEEAKNKGITLLMEYPAKGDFSTSGTLMKFFELFPNIFLCLDIGHLHRAKQDLEKEKEIIESLKNRINYLHINDCSGVRNEHGNFGEKESHYKEILSYIKQHCSIRKGIIEASNDTDAKNILKSMKGL